MISAEERSEILELSALDGLFYSRYFFPKTARQESPAFHAEIWGALEHPQHRYTDVMVFRGGAKTTILRLFASKRVAFALSRTILYIGKSEAHAARSINWIKKQVMFNPIWSSVFQLEKGSIWSGTECEILHGVEEVSIRLLALGITGSVRGINVEDYRPDLIIVDDPCDEENTATPEQRQKISELFFGAIKESLAPASECPDAKMVLLQTPLDKEDLISQCQVDAEWNSLRFACWTRETEGARLEDQMSIWPQRWTSKVLRAEKAAALARNQASIWYREKECKIVARETSDFMPEWVKYWDVLPDRMTKILVIDPVPPPTENQIAKGLAKKDYEVLHVLGIYAGRVYALEYAMNKGHEPDWTVIQFFRLMERYKPRKAVIHAINYEKTLQWIIEQAMRAKKRWYQVDTFSDRRSKRDRIVDGLNGPLSQGAFLLAPGMTELAEQISAYPNVSHDDVIETAAIGCERLLLEGDIDGEYELLEEEDNIPALGNWRAAP